MSFEYQTVYEILRDTRFEAAYIENEHSGAELAV